MNGAGSDERCLPVAAQSGTVCRVALGYAVGGDLRFLSHLDEARLLARALARAGWPVAYTCGFNPRPRLAVLLPRSVGTAADCQVAVVGLRENAGEQVLFEQLAAQMPPAAPLRWVSLPAPLRTPQPCRVTYELEVDPDEIERLTVRIEEVLAADSVVEAHAADRPARRGAPPRQIDIRTYIEKLELDGGRLRVVLRFVAQRSARPSEVIRILGLLPEAYLHRLRRTAIQWDTEPAGPLRWPAVPARNELGTQEDYGRQRNSEH